MKSLKHTLFTLSLLALAAPSFAQSVSCKVVGVSDGDTLTCLGAGNVQYKTRLYGIDAPESRQAFGTQAKSQLSSLVFGKQVTLDIKDKDTDRYGRHVADVKVNGQSANLAQVESGHAWAYRQYLQGADKNTYVAAESRARAAKRGLWSQPNPINPSDFRKGVKGGTYTPPAAATTRQPSLQSGSTSSSSGFSCGTKRTCKAMTSCAEAKHYLNVCKVSRLDGDGDGVPCESLCR